MRKQEHLFKTKLVSAKVDGTILPQKSELGNPQVFAGEKQYISPRGLYEN